MRKSIILLCIVMICNNAVANHTKVDTFFSLPFRIATFSARVVKNTEIKLTFTVAETFTNVTHFEVTRSTNNIDFVNIGTVIQTDNSPTSHTYEFTDNMLNTITNDVIYYRLKQVTSEGRVTYGITLPVKLKTTKSNTVNVWPIPSSGAVTIHFENTTNEQVTLKYYDTKSSLLHQETINSNKGNCTISSNVMTNWNKGSYILQVYTGTELIGSKIIIKN